MSDRPGIDRGWTRADAVYRRGICPVCQQEQAIRNDGRVRVHRRWFSDRRNTPCAGADEQPVRVTLRPAG